MFVAVDGRPAGLVGVADPIKATTHEAIETLPCEGIKVVMLTGDNRTTAEAPATIARQRRLSRSPSGSITLKPTCSRIRKPPW